MVKITLLILSFHIAGFGFNKDRFLDLLSKPTPSWIADQIEEELQFFKTATWNPNKIEEVYNSIKIGEVYNSMKPAQLYWLKIENNEIFYQPTQNMEHCKKKILPLICILKKMASCVKLPDCEFLFSVDDQFNNFPSSKNLLYPAFTICKRKGNMFSILWPEIYGLQDRLDAINRIVKEEKHWPWKNKIDQGIWRGRFTREFKPYEHWAYNTRPRLVIFASQHPDLVDAKFPPHIEQVKKLPNSYIGEYIQPEQQIQYKYLFAIDGNTFPTSYIWQLASNCCVLKQESEYIEWFYKGLIDRTHYVGFHKDCQDLPKIIHWLRKNPEKAESIANESKKFAYQYLHMEGAAYYIYKILSAYALMCEERQHFNNVL